MFKIEMKAVAFALIFGALLSGEACAQSTCRPIETRSPNAPDQKPAFVGQTRVCETRSNVAYEVTVVAKGLDRPWAVEPLPDGGFLVTEKPGRIRVISATGEIGEPLTGAPAVGQGGVTEASAVGGLPPITARGQGGLLDIALSPNFANDRTVFWTFSETREGGSGTSVARGVISKDWKRLEQVKLIFRSLPAYDNGLHFGSRIVFAPDGRLFVTTGDRFDPAVNRPRVQKLDNHLGKIVRIEPDGSIPEDNPFVGTAGALPEIWTLGHRNLQSATLDDKGRLWTVEHGAQGGDELNLIRKGKNYGWPVVTYGEEYSGQPISGSTTDREGFERPVYYWDPVIAPSGMEFYTGKAFPAWRGSIFVGGLASKRLVRLVIEGERVVGEEHLLTDRDRRIRDVRQGPDGFLYAVTDHSDGELLRIAPKK
jgi:glucose/arabinose dehydrogenase